MIVETKTKQHHSALRKGREKGQNRHVWQEDVQTDRDAPGTNHPGNASQNQGESISRRPGRPPSGAGARRWPQRGERAPVRCRPQGEWCGCHGDSVQAPGQPESRATAWPCNPTFGRMAKGSEVRVSKIAEKLCISLCPGPWRGVPTPSLLVAAVFGLTRCHARQAPGLWLPQKDHAVRRSHFQHPLSSTKPPRYRVLRTSRLVTRRGPGPFPVLRIRPPVCSASSCYKNQELCFPEFCEPF